MRVTLLGHACVWVEMEDLACLVDPVLFDPFEEGVVVSCPPRSVDLVAMPRPDLVIVTHRHPDHFEIRSLSALPKGCRVLCPADPLLVYALERLGFASVNPVPPGRPVSFPDSQLFPTRSEEGPLEFGLVFHDSTGTFWHQVDTSVSVATVRGVLERFRRVDLLLARYASQNFDFFESRTTAFPYEDHQRNLETVLAVDPGAVVPGSAGFRFTGEHEWLNRFLFPISPDRFAVDLRRLKFPGEIAFMGPGDIAELSGGAIRVRREASSFVRAGSADRDALRFDPTSAIPDLQDSNDAGYPGAELEEGVRHLVEDQFFPCVRDAVKERLSVPWLYGLYGVLYGVEVVLPRGSRAWELDFGGPDVSLREGWTQPQFVHRIAGSVLTEWAAQRRSYFSVRAYSRRFSTLTVVAGNVSGVQVAPVALPDLLTDYVLNRAPGSADAARRRVDLEIERWAKGGQRVEPFRRMSGPGCFSFLRGRLSERSPSGTERRTKLLDRRFQRPRRPVGDDPIDVRPVPWLHVQLASAGRRKRSAPLPLRPGAQAASGWPRRSPATSGTVARSRSRRN